MIKRGVETQHRNRFGRHWPQDYVRVKRVPTAHLYPDVERRQPPLDLAALVLELDPPTLEGRPEIHTSVDESADLGEANAHITQGEDPADVG